MKEDLARRRKLLSITYARGDHVGCPDVFPRTKGWPTEASFPVVPGELDAASLVKPVGRIRLGRPANSNSKLKNPEPYCPTSAKRTGNHLSFLSLHLQCSSNVPQGSIQLLHSKYIFPGPHRKSRFACLNEGFHL